jgi:hypothetical protein
MQVRWSEPHRVAVLDPQGDLGIRTMVEMKNTIGSLLRDGCRTLIVTPWRPTIGRHKPGRAGGRLCRARELSGTLSPGESRRGSGADI